MTFSGWAGAMSNRPGPERLRHVQLDQARYFLPGDAAPGRGKAAEPADQRHRCAGRVVALADHFQQIVEHLFDGRLGGAPRTSGISRTLAASAWPKAIGAHSPSLRFRL